MVFSVCFRVWELALKKNVNIPIFAYILITSGYVQQQEQEHVTCFLHSRKHQQGLWMNSQCHQQVHFQHPSFCTYRECAIVWWVTILWHIHCVGGSAIFDKHVSWFPFPFPLPHKFISFLLCWRMSPIVALTKHACCQQNSLARARLAAGSRVLCIWACTEGSISIQAGFPFRTNWRP